MSCRGEGSTHFACDCTLERMRKLETVAKAARALTPLTNMDGDASHKEIAADLLIYLGYALKELGND